MWWKRKRKKIRQQKSELICRGEKVQFSAVRSPDLGILASAIQWEKKTPFNWRQGQLSANRGNIFLCWKLFTCLIRENNLVQLVNQIILDFKVVGKLKWPCVSLVWQIHISEVVFVILLMAEMYYYKQQDNSKKKFLAKINEWCFTKSFVSTLICQLFSWILYKHLKSKARNSYEKVKYLNQWLVSQCLVSILWHINSQDNQGSIFLNKIILKAQNETSLNTNWLVL